MNQTEQSLEQKRKKLKMIDRWYGILVVSGMLIVLAGVFIWDNLNVMFAGMVPTCIAVFVLQPFVRCPHCGRQLNMKFGLPRQCPDCKKSIL